MSLDIKNLSYVEQDVGQHIKSSKKHFIWEFLLEGRPHKIELYDSRISGKKKLVKDGQVWKEVEGDISFSKSFEIGKYSCTIIQHGEKYELRIDNQSFSHLLDLEKNRVYFSSSNIPTSNSYVSKPTNVSSKIAFGTGQMNQQNSTQKHNSLFNFSIKNTGTQKRMSEMPSHDFNFNNFPGNRESKDFREERNPNYPSNQNGRSQSVLLDFTDTNLPQQAHPSQNKANTLDVLGSLDFSGNSFSTQSANTQNVIKNTPNQESFNMFDLSGR